MTTFSAPITFVCTASKGLYSHAGTCFSAAAWTITSTPRSRLRQPLETADVAEQEPNPLLALEAALQVVLLELVAAVDAYGGRLVLVEQAR